MMTARGLFGMWFYIAYACAGLSETSTSTWISLVQVNAHTHRSAASSWKSNSRLRDHADEVQKGFSVALAFHGHYMRNEGSGDTQNVAFKYIDGNLVQRHYSDGQTCSNFFLAEPNIREMIIQPLERDGARVSIYVDSHSREDCLWRDEELREVLQPTRISIASDTQMWADGSCFNRHGNIVGCRIVDSYIRVLNLVLQDKSIIDYIVLLRFDVTYSLPITSWNMTWGATYAAFAQSGHLAFAHNRFVDQEGDDADIDVYPEYRNWKACRMVSDLLFTLPINHAEPLIRALDWSGKNKTNIEHIGVEGPYKGKQVMCYHDGGDGHFVWQPFVKEMGEGSLRIMDNRLGLRSDDTGTGCKSFLCIDRSCGADYNAECK